LSVLQYSNTDVPELTNHQVWGVPKYAQSLENRSPSQSSYCLFLFIDYHTVAKEILPGTYWPGQLIILLSHCSYTCKK